MLEALISLRLDHAADSGPKKRGDVLVVALPDSPWSDLERRHFAVVEWEDPNLETQLFTRQLAGEAIPRLALPYATRDADGNLLSRATERLDIQKIPAGIRAQLLDPTRRVEKLTTASLEAAGALIRSKKQPPADLKPQA
jgi:hypothetical protein